MKEIERNLNKNFSNACDWFEDNKLSIHTVTYLGCLLDETYSGESMALKVINKINSRLRFLY